MQNYYNVFYLIISYVLQAVFRIRNRMDPIHLAAWIPIRIQKAKINPFYKKKVFLAAKMKATFAVLKSNIGILGAL